jgi:hypothetical protein
MRRSDIGAQLDNQRRDLVPDAFDASISWPSSLVIFFYGRLFQILAATLDAALATQLDCGYSTALQGDGADCGAGVRLNTPSFSKIVEPFRVDFLH